MAADVKTQHPDYADRFTEWADMRKSARGEKAIKESNEAYLPMPSGFRAQEDGGAAYYASYKTRAQFPEILQPTLRGMVGVVHRVEAQIEGLENNSLSYLWEKATPDGLPLEALHRQITDEILLMGRHALLTDVRSVEAGGDGLPYIASYTAERLTNWDQDRSFYVLDESGAERTGFEWEDVTRFRVLRFEGGVYTQQVYESDQLTEGAVFSPRMAGNGGALDQIPFVVVGPRNLAVTVDEPPLKGVARSSIAMYQLNADYRHQLYMTGQETFVVINADAPGAIGAGVVIELKGGTDNARPEAKYVSPSGSGIAAHRTALVDERNSAAAAGARMFDHDEEAARVESGASRRLRYAAQTATLTSVSVASGLALETALRHAARFVGIDPNTIVVKPNLRFVDTVLPPSEATELVKVWQAGAISKLTLYENLQRGEIASPERTFEEEEELIEQDVIDQPLLGAGAAVAGMEAALAPPAPAPTPEEELEAEAA